jgi:tetratricopeptide (TPR) repeat protein
LVAQEVNEIGGIGATVKWSRETGFALSKIIPGSPADQLPRDIGLPRELISIDDVSLKGFSAQEANDRLEGPVGSEVKLTFLNTFSANASHTFLTRCKIIPPPTLTENYVTFANTSSMIDSPASHAAQSFISQAHKANSIGDFLGASALCKLSESSPAEFGNSHRSSRASCLAQAGLFYIRTGNLKKINSVSNQLREWIADANFKTSPLDNPGILKFVEELSGIDASLTESLYRSLIDKCTSKRSDSYPYASYLRSFALFLAEHKQTTEAASICDKLLEPPTSATELSWSQLQVVADLFFHIGDNRKSSSLYRKAIESYDIKTHGPQKTHDKQRPPVSLLCRLVSACLRGQETEAAVEAVEEAVKRYREFPNEALIFYEQCPSFTPSMSDLLILAGDIHSLILNAERSKTYYEEAFSLLKHALGSNNPLTQRAGEKIDCHSPISKDDLSIPRDIPTINEAGKSVGESTASLTTRLLDTYALLHDGNAQQSELNAELLLADFAQRGDLSSSNSGDLARCFELSLAFRHQNPQLALKLLRTLESHVNRTSTDLPLPNAILSASIAVLCEELRDAPLADSSWQKLEDTLRSLELEHSANAPLKKREEPIQAHKGEMLRWLANAFRLGDQHEIAQRLLDRATEAGANQDVVSCDRALVCMSATDVDGARINWQGLLNSTSSINSQSQDKLLELADSLIVLGNKNDAQEILRRINAVPLKPAAVLQLAKLHNALEQYSEAERLLQPFRTKPTNQYLMAELALCLEKQDKLSEACQLYSDTANGTHVSHAYAACEKANLLKHALRLKERLSGPDSPDLVPLLTKLGEALRISGEPDASVTSRAIEIDSRSNRTHLDDVGALRQLAESQFAAGDFEQYTKTGKHLAFRFKEEGKLQQAIRSLLAVALREFGQGRKAEALSDAFLSIEWERGLQETESGQGIGGENDSFINELLKHDQLEEAKALLIKALEMRERCFGKRHQLVALCLSNLARVLYRMNDWEVFDQTVDRILSIYKARGGRSENPALSAQCSEIRQLERISDDMLDSLGSERRLQILQRILNVQQTLFGPFNAQIAHTLGAISRLHIKVGAYAEAEPVLKRTLEIHEALSGGERQFVVGVRDQYITVLKQLGQEEAAQRLMTIHLSPFQGRHKNVSLIQGLKRQVANRFPHVDRPQIDPELLEEARSIVAANTGRFSNDSLEVLRLFKQHCLASGDEQRGLELLLEEIEFLKNVEGHHGLGTISASLEMASVFRRKAQFPAMKIWLSRASAAVDGLAEINHKEIDDFLKIAEQLGALAADEKALSLIELIIETLTRTAKSTRVRDVQRCSKLLQALTANQKSEELAKADSRIMSEQETTESPEQLTRTFSECTGWSQERTARWLHSNSLAVDVETSIGYLLCLANKQSKSSDTSELRETLAQLENLWQQLSTAAKDEVFVILRGIHNDLIARVDYSIAEEGLDLLTKASLRLSDSTEHMSDPVIALLHTIGNIYQSQFRYDELEVIRRRELHSFMPMHYEGAGESSCLELWEQSVDRGKLNDATGHFTDICKQIIAIEDLGFVALAELIPDLAAIAIKAGKPKRVDVILDVVMEGIVVDKFTATSTSMNELFEALSVFLEQAKWFHEALMLRKRALEMQLEHSFSSPLLAPELRKIMNIWTKTGESEQIGPFCEHLLKLVNDTAVVETEFKRLLQEQYELFSKSNQEASDFRERLAKARMHQNDPALATREFSNTLCQYIPKVQIKLLRPAIRELLRAYGECLIADRNSSQSVWQFAQNFSARYPDESMLIIEPLSEISIKRIAQGEALQPFQHYLLQIKNSTRSSAVNQEIEKLLAQILSSAISGSGATPENRLTAASTFAQKIYEQPAEKQEEFSKQIVQDAISASIDEGGDGCLAVPIIIAIARSHTINGNDDLAILAMKEALTQYSVCTDTQHIDLTTRELWRWAENDLRRGKRLGSIALLVIIPLLQLSEKQILTSQVESDVDRGIISVAHELFRQNKVEESELLLLEAIKIRETVKGPESRNLLQLLVCRAGQLERQRQFQQCRELYDRIIHITILNFGELSDMVISRRIEAASCCVRMGIFEQAGNQWRQALGEFCSRSAAQAGPQPANKLLPLPSGLVQSFCRLAEQYYNKSLVSEAETIIVEILPHWPPSGSEKLEELFNNLVARCFQEERFSLAESFLQQAISADSIPLLTRNHLRTQLSEYYLSTGKMEESKKLFDQIMQSASANGLDTKVALRRRAKALTARGMEREAAEINSTLPQSVKIPTFEFALFAVEEIILSGNTEVASYKSSLTAPQRGIHSNSANIGSFGAIKLEGNGRVKGSVVQPGNQSAPGNSANQIRGGRSRPRTGGIHRIGSSSSESSLPVPDLNTYDFAPALPPPEAGTYNQHQNRARTSREFTHAGRMSPGDYVLNELDAGHLRMPEEGRVRIFITDPPGKAASGYAVRLRHLEAKKPIDMQIWYQGTREIDLHSAHHIVATIYAPNATVRLGGNAMFAGAILANRIIADGNTLILFDEDLAGVAL